MNIRISHEVPISLLQKSRSFNDIDYLLPHLYEQHPEYKEYYKNARSVYNREVLCDTSVFELGVAFDWDKYMDIVTEVKPNMMIIPDVLEDAAETISTWEKFTSKFSDRLNVIDARKIGVVQGKTLEELERCYEFIARNADIVAFSFDMSYYDAVGVGNTKLERMCDGRPRFIEQLIEDDLWNWNKPVHLLGCSLPQEFSFYVRNNIHNIRSIDTSNPIVHGLHEIQYNSTFGLKDKVKVKLADMITATPTPTQTEIIEYNVQQFAKIIRGCM